MSGDRALTYADVGATRPELERWTAPAGYRTYERTVPIGSGTASWEAVASALLEWARYLRALRALA
jgi:uncharacterized protein (UPF0548 family)